VVTRTPEAELKMGDVSFTLKPSKESLTEAVTKVMRVELEKTKKEGGISGAFASSYLNDQKSFDRLRDGAVNSMWSVITDPKNKDILSDRDKIAKVLKDTVGSNKEIPWLTRSKTAKSLEKFDAVFCRDH
jgi:hypothetical protein